MHEIGPIKSRPTSLQPRKRWRLRPARRPPPAPAGLCHTWSPQGAGARPRPHVLNTSRPAHRTPARVPAAAQSRTQGGQPTWGAEAAPLLSLRREGLSSELAARDRPPSHATSRPLGPALPFRSQLRRHFVPDEGKRPDMGSVSASLYPALRSTPHCARTPDIWHDPHATEPGFCLLQSWAQGAHARTPQKVRPGFKSRRMSCKSGPVLCVKRQTPDPQVFKTVKPLKSPALHRPETRVQPRPLD